MLHRRAVLGLLAAAPFLTRPAMAAQAEVFSDGGLATRGADPVAFFDLNGPVTGDAGHALMWKGAEWRFASAANMAKFEADPEAYAPQYGGYCAFAMSLGSIASTVPDAWTVHEGKLYLNYSVIVRSRWNEDRDNNIVKADGHWPDILMA